MISGAILRTEGLSKRFGDFLAVDGVNLEVRRGEIHALIGPNGAGKTTVFNLLTKFHVPSTGTITFEDRDITAESPTRTARLGMVRSFQISAVFTAMSVLENVRVALQSREALVMQFWQPARALDRLNERALDLLTQVGMRDLAPVLAGSLPYGQRRALEFATTLAMEPKLLLLDEPTQGMGSEDVQRIAQLIKLAARDRTVLMVEHNMGVVADIADRISVLQRGSVLTTGSYEQISTHPAVIEAYLGRRGAH
jgi:branched-chain amino acid transport system ATP-binding protein